MAFPDPKLGLVLNYGYPDTWGIILAGFLPSQDLRPLGLCRSVSLHFSKLSAINAIELAIGKPACPASQRRTYSGPHVPLETDAILGIFQSYEDHHLQRPAS